MPKRRKRKIESENTGESTRALSWFPGHMYKAQKRLSQEIGSIDVVIELRDARLPRRSGNPELARLVGNRKHLLLFNKASLADPELTRVWQDFYNNTGLKTLFLDADSRRGLNLIFPILKSLTSDSREGFKRRGIRPPPQRLMIVGMPNVGKSTLINRMIRENRLSTAPTPGHTRGVLWVHLKNDYLLMDTPGLMLPRLHGENEAMPLGWIGAIRDSILGTQRLAITLLEAFSTRGELSRMSIYGIETSGDESAEIILERICLQRGFIIQGGQPDLERAAETLLHDFRSGALGRFTLETP